MDLISVPVLGLNARWSPAPYAPALLGLTRQLGQTPGGTPPAAAPEKVALFDIDAPLLAFLTAVVASTGTAILGHSFGVAHSRWSTVFWALSGITGFKALIDLSRLR